MRNLLRLSVAVVLLVGCGVRPCKNGTVLLTVKVDSSAGAVDTFDVALSLDSGAAQHAFVSRKAGTIEGTIEVDFAQGYMPGGQLRVAIIGTANGAAIAFGSTTQTLSSSCQSMTVVVGASGAVKQVGEPAVPGDNCVSGHIADGYCCEKACDGQCEACDVEPGKCQAIAGVPHGSRTACGGADVPAPCGPQTCDGTTRGACNWPTVVCAAGSCTGGMETAPAMCSNGMCPAGTTKACAGGICGADACATVTQLAAGDAHTCALLSDSTVKCWGANDHGQLGLGAATSADAHVPKLVPGLKNVAQIASGSQHTCAAMNDGTVHCWGSNVYGALGRGDWDNTDPAILHGVPQVVISSVGGPAFGNVAQIASGPMASHTCAVLLNGETWCWGLNSAGQIGNGASLFPMQGKGQAIPNAVCLSGTGCSTGAAFKPVAVGNGDTCGVNAAGNIQCWGSNAISQLSFPNDNNPHPNPTTYAAGRLISVGTASECFLTADASGKVQCWGHGLLGDGASTATSNQSTPQFVCTMGTCQNDVLNVLANVSQVSVGGSFMCAVRLGAVKCWGVNDHGQLGDGTAVPSNNVASTTTIADNAAHVVTGLSHACAILLDGTVKCWGSDTNGQLGDDDAALANKNAPVAPHW